MKNTLPFRIDPYRASDQSLTFTGSFSAEHMSRLSSMNVRVLHSISVQLAFSRDESKAAVLKGQLSLVVELRCERCLNLYQQPLETTFLLGVVEDMKAADALPKSYEPVFSINHELMISDLIEDEVLLALPIIPKHPLDECDVDSSTISDEAASFSSKERESAHPFHVLNVLKNKH